MCIILLTGATGKHVVLQLLQQNQDVRTIVRSKQRLLDLLEEIAPESSSKIADRLEVTEASLLDLSDEELQKATRGCDAVVSCLGHNVTFQGMFGNPRRLVTDAVKRLHESIEANHSEGVEDTAKEEKAKDKTKFILMGTVAVSNPSGGDDKRTFGERVILLLLRHLLPPHRDNETAAEYIFSVNSPNVEWAVVRPTTLIDGPSTKYELFDKPQDSLFGGNGVATRANVAKSMVDMLLTDKLWEEWKFKWPVIHDLN